MCVVGLGREAKGRFPSGNSHFMATFLLANQKLSDASPRPDLLPISGMPLSSSESGVPNEEGKVIT